jgi:putative ABC transport system permease protein
MNLRAWIRWGLEEMLANRSRTVLAMFSVVVGIWSVTVVVAAGDVGRRSLLQNLEATLGRPATITIGIGTVPTGETISQVRSQVRSALVRFGNPSSSPVESLSMPVGPSSAEIPMTVVGAGPGLADVRLLQMSAGRWLADVDNQDFAPMLVLNTSAVQRLGLISPSAAVGSILWIGTLQPVVGRVVGVLASTTQESPVAYLPAGVLERWGAPPGANLTFSYLARVNPAEADVFAGAISFTLRHWGLGSSLTVARTDHSDALSSGLLAVQLVLASIAGISLVTGGIGVLNLGLVSVRARAHEFGIRRAFGATTLSIFVAVLAEAVLTAVVAGIAGVLLALLTAAFLPELLASLVGGSQVAPSFPLSAALIGIGLSGALGLLAGLIPARKATRRDVMQAIRL